jgi:hypothetical protein
MHAWLSLIVPTRGRPRQLRGFLDSVAATAYHPERLEVLLVIDDDDRESAAVDHPRLHIRRVVGRRGRTMGKLNDEGFRASRGDRVMLANDDVVVRTRGWDATILDALRRFPDPFVLVHVNDTLIREHLCVFPLVSREFCELAGGICPTEYLRYRIDDHIEDVFNILAAVGERRTLYFPDVVFEHTNAVDHPTAGRVYQSDPAILAIDAARFDAMFTQRKELALKALELIGGRTAGREREIAAMRDPFALRVAGRQVEIRAPWWRRKGELAKALVSPIRRVHECWRMKGLRGLAVAARRRLAP